MGLLNIFPTQIYTDFIPESLADKIEEIITSRISSLEYHKEVYTDFHLSNPIVNKTEISPFLAYLKLIADKYTQESGIKQTKFGNYWIQDYKTSNHHGAHRHPNCSISGTYYVRANENAGELIFHTPNPYSSMTTYIHSEENAFSIKPQKGLVVLFPSWLAHEIIPSNHPDCIRTSFSFNLGI